MELEEFGKLSSQIMKIVYSKQGNGDHEFTMLDQLFEELPSKYPREEIYGFLVELAQSDWLTLIDSWSPARGGDVFIDLTPKGRTYHERQHQRQSARFMDNFIGPIVTAIVVALFTWFLAA